MRRRLKESAPISTPTSWADIAARREGTLQACEDEEGIAHHIGQPQLVDRDYKKLAHRTSRTGGLAKLSTMRR